MDPDALGNAGTPEERRTGLGGSDAAAALGLSPWQSPYELWEQKTGLAPPVEETEAMRWGKLLEGVIRREYAHRTGHEVQPVKEMMRHPEHPWMFAHVDGVVSNGAILEVKTTRDTRGWGDPGTDEIPLHFLTQVHHYLAIAQAQVCDVAVLFGGQDLQLYQVERDTEIEQQLIDGEADFWRRVIDADPPPATSLQDAVRRWGHFNAQGYTVAGEEEQRAVEVLRRGHQLRRELDEAEERAKLVIMSTMGEIGQSLVHPVTGEILATWKLDSGRKAYSVAAREPSRRFLVKNLEDA